MQLPVGHVPEMLAVLNTTVLELFASLGASNITHAQREFAYHFEKALATWWLKQETTLQQPCQKCLPMLTLHFV